MPELGFVPDQLRWHTPSLEWSPTTITATYIPTLPCFSWCNAYARNTLLTISNLLTLRCLLRPSSSAVFSKKPALVLPEENFLSLLWVPTALYGISSHGSEHTLSGNSPVHMSAISYLLGEILEKKNPGQFTCLPHSAQHRAWSMIVWCKGKLWNQTELSPDPIWKSHFTSQGCGASISSSVKPG